VDLSHVVLLSLSLGLSRVKGTYRESGEGGGGRREEALSSGCLRWLIGRGRKKRADTFWGGMEEEKWVWSEKRKKKKGQKSFPLLSQQISEMKSEGKKSFLRYQ